MQKKQNRNVDHQMHHRPNYIADLSKTSSSPHLEADDLMKKPVKTLLIKLSESARRLGLKEVDFNTAVEFVEHREYGLCFDTIVTQLYEYDVPISEAFYLSVCEIANEIQTPEESFSFLAELISGHDSKT